MTDINIIMTVPEITDEIENSIRYIPGRATTNGDISITAYGEIIYDGLIIGSIERNRNGGQCFDCKNYLEGKCRYGINIDPDVGCNIFYECNITNKEV